MKMDDPNDVCYLLQLIIRQLFIFLQDFIIYESVWSTYESDEFDNVHRSAVVESYTLPGDYGAFLIACSILGILLLLSTKYTNEQKKHYHPVPKYLRNHEIITDDDCEDEEPNVLFNLATPESGDGWFNNPSEFQNNSLTKVIPKYSQCVSTKPRNAKKLKTKWLIRKTRSGHVYGKCSFN